MQLLSIAITLVVVVLVSAMILKKYKPHAILLGGGIVLLLSAQFLGINNIITDVEKSTGFWLFDVFELMRTTLQKDGGSYRNGHHGCRRLCNVHEPCGRE